jgi:hypothetical protein
MPVVVLCGTDYEMGFQYGSQAGQYIELVRDEVWVAALVRYSRRGVMQSLEEFERLIREHVPEAEEMMRGMADGAAANGHDISYTDILLINCDFNLGRLVPRSSWPGDGLHDVCLPDGRGCSQWSAWGRTTLDGRLITADSGDGVFDFHVVVLAFPAVGNNYITLSTAGWLGQKAAMNSRGVFIGVGGGFPTRQIDYDYGVPYPCAIHHLLRCANSATEAKEMFLSWPCDVTVVHFADTRGKAFVVERTAALWTFREPGDFGEVDFIYSSNNFFNPEMRDSVGDVEFVEHAGWVGRDSGINSIPRNLEMWNMLNNYRGKVDVEFARMMWRFPGDPPPYPLNYNAAKAFHETLGKGWDQKICNQDNAFIGIGLPDDGDSGIMYVCTGPAGRMANPLGPLDGDWYQVNGTHSFYKLFLAATPAAVVGHAKETAHDYIAEAHRGLRELTYSDIAYVPLKELLATATSEYFCASNAYNKGLLADGDAAMRYLASALTGYTRAQAHAKQVRNALSPPPECPEDLGLRPYGGAWGSWAVRGS